MIMGAGPTYLPAAKRDVSHGGCGGRPPTRQTKRRGGSSPSERSAAIEVQQTLDTYL